MAQKIRRGFFRKHYYCGACNSPVSAEDSVCQKCGSPLEEFPRPEPAAARAAEKKPEPVPIKRMPPAAVPKTRPRPAPEPVEEPPPAEYDEGEYEEEYSEEAGTEYPGEEYEEAPAAPMPPAKKGIAGLIEKVRPRSIAWFVVIILVLYGFFFNDAMFLVAGVLVLIGLELEAIRRKLKA